MIAKRSRTFVLVLILAVLAGTGCKKPDDKPAAPPAATPAPPTPPSPPPRVIDMDAHGKATMEFMSELLAVIKSSPGDCPKTVAALRAFGEANKARSIKLREDDALVTDAQREAYLKVHEAEMAPVMDGLKAAAAECERAPGFVDALKIVLD